MTTKTTLGFDVPTARSPVTRLAPAGTLASSGDPVVLTAASAGWKHCGLRVVALEPGATRTIATNDKELFVLPLSATDVSVAVEYDGTRERFHLDGRAGVFAKVSDFLYVGRDSVVTVSAIGGGEIALPSARCERSLPPRYGPAGDIAVEIRGAGPATRQVTNFASPEAWPYADRLMCVELLTPDGNWSSYPPHKHDDSSECTVNNEELYYFRIGQTGTTDVAVDGFGLHRTYTAARPDLPECEQVDDNVVIHDGDVYLIERGYHGPCIAAPGYPMYYLNVLAGSDGERSMAFCDDPAHHWVRDAWTALEPDPRCPMTDASGVVR